MPPFYESMEIAKEFANIAWAMKDELKLKEILLYGSVAKKIQETLTY